MPLATLTSLHRVPPRSGAALALALLAPVVLALLVFPTPLYDTRELIAWGRHWPLVTPDHPPLMAWIGGTVDLLAGPSGLAMIVANQVALVIGLVHVHAVLRLAAPQVAWLGTVLYGASIYAAVAPLSYALNADILQLMSWPAVIRYVLAGLQSQRLRDWLLAGVWAGLAMLTKYNGALLLLGLAAAVIAVRGWRSLLLQPGPWCAVLAALVVFSPHLVGLTINNHAVSYGLARFLPDAGLAARVNSLGQFVLGDVGFLVPGVIIAGFGLRRGALRWRAASPSEAARIVVGAALVTHALVVLLILLAGLDYIARFSAPYVVLLALAGGALLSPGPDMTFWLERRVARVLIGIFAPLVVITAVFYGGFASHSGLQEPLAAETQHILEAWRARHDCGPAALIGQRSSVYGIGAHAPRDIVTISWRDIAGAPWFDRARLDRFGAIIVDPSDQVQQRIAAYAPGLVAGPPQKLALPLLRTRTGREIQQTFYFVAPTACPAK
jgi:hypothetical protein